ncbi:MAG: alpha-L-rhamnosidase C-terminal domain-containing protein [Umezawaea sp.]
MDDERSDEVTRRQFLGAAVGAGAVVALGAGPARAEAAPPPLGFAAPEPHEPLHGGGFVGPAVPESPDPLVRYRWDRPVASDAQAKPTNYDGAFDCSDPKLTRIWYTGAHTTRAGFLAGSMSAILMDRGDRFAWAGDCHPMQATALAAFGDRDFVRKNIGEMVGAHYDIESYALYWVLGLVEYYWNSGDGATLTSYVDTVRARLDHGDQIYADPHIAFYGWDERLGAGFEAGDRPETKRAYRVLFIQTCREFAAAADAVGRGDLGAAYRSVADWRTAELHADPDWFAGFGIHALADAVNAGCVPPEDQDRITRAEFADRLTRLSFSPFNQFHILRAMARLGSHDDALTTIQDTWGRQIDYGGTTFFEVFRPDWLDVIGRNEPVPHSQSGWTSLAHPWSAGVTAWLSAEILGIRPTAPGFATVDVFPRPGRTLTWVAGRVPTPTGEVRVRLDVRTGRGEVVIPAGSVGRVGIPAAGRRIVSVRVDGRVARPGGTRPPDGVAAVVVAGETLVLEGVRPGRYRLEVDYRGSTAFDAGSLDYPMRFAGRDTTTSGDWGGVHGRDDHVLFDYDGQGVHRAALPGYVTSVVPTRDGGGGGFGNSLDCVWEVGTRDRRALAPDRTNGGPRTAGCLYTATPQAVGMTMSLDVTVTPRQRLPAGDVLRGLGLHRAPDLRGDLRPRHAQAGRAGATGRLPPRRPVPGLRVRPLAADQDRPRPGRQRRAQRSVLRSGRPCGRCRRELITAAGRDRSACGGRVAVEGKP